jgi:B9 domain-containing protein 2
MDWHGRRLLAGYGFAHLPLQPGPHRLEVSLWRPVGAPDQEIDALLLGRTPALVSHEPIYDSAWKDRSRMVTVSAGRVIIDIIVVTRFLKEQGIDESLPS